VSVPGGLFCLLGYGSPNWESSSRGGDFRNKVPIFASSEEFPNIGSELTEFFFTAHEGSQQQDHMKCNSRWFDILIRATTSPLVLSFLLVWVALCPGAAIAEDQTGPNMWFAPQVHQLRDKASFANTDKTGVGRTDHAKVEDKRGLFPLRTKGENNEVGKVEKELYRLGANAATVGIESAAMQLGRSFLERVPEKSMEVMRHRLGHLLPEIKVPDWLKRVDLDIDLNWNEGPVYSIRTRQPLFQSDHKIDTIFTQLRWGKDFQFGTWRDTTNLGIGYRRLLMDKTLLVGANTFFDRDWRKGHNRFGWGLEARWFVVDIR